MLPSVSEGASPRARVPQPSLLDDFPMFEGVDPFSRRALLEAAEPRVLRPGEVLLRESGANDRMYLILEGELGVYLAGTGKEPVATLGPGESVGEMSLLDGAPASASVVAETRCRLLSVDESAFWRLVESSHPFALSLLVKLTGRLRANNATVSQSVILRRRYERAAMFDGLTGIHNRRWLDETLHRLVSRVEGSDGASLSIALLDIDHFKNFNDSYGHEAGDHVLTIVAQVLANNLRPTDLVARFGGEEFVILFPDTDLHLAKLASERVRGAIAAETLTMDERRLPHVTISLGVAQFRSGQTVPELLKAADSAMYRAKEAGRNQVMLAEG
jgi:diguanylate cyclase (GGDEF)-like protein